jgi:3-hydroxyisobutyrate dehydrogenase
LLPSLSVLAPGATIILSSTCPPSGTLLLSHRLAALTNKPQLVDAPVSGGTLRAANGDLSIMASGDESALDKGRKVLEGLTGQGV